MTYCLACGDKHVEGEYKCLGCGQPFCYQHACAHWGVRSEVADSMRREIMELRERQIALETELKKLLERQQHSPLRFMEVLQNADAAATR